MLGQLPALISLSREAQDIWSQLEGTDQERVDALFRRVIKMLPTPARLAQVRGYLIESKDPLPARLAGAFLHPETRRMMAESNFELDVGVTQAEISDTDLMMML